MTIHASDPFATPEGDRSPVRRLRGRLAAPVTLWAAGRGEFDRAGLTVSSTMVVDGDPGRVVGIIDEESTLWEALNRTGRFTVAPLSEPDRHVADIFAGVLPSAGGPFRGGQWSDTEYGPVLSGVAAWAGCRLDEARSVGWALLVVARIDRVEIAAGAPAAPLIHYRGRYLSLSRNSSRQRPPQ